MEIEAGNNRMQGNNTEYAQENRHSATEAQQRKKEYLPGGIDADQDPVYSGVSSDDCCIPDRSLTGKQQQFSASATRASGGLTRFSQAKSDEEIFVSNSGRFNSTKGKLDRAL